MKSESEELLAQWAETWKKRYPTLDGLHKRPTVELCVNNAMTSPHRERFATKGTLTWVEEWLTNENRGHLQNYYLQLKDFSQV